jgi:hypothetical protein
MKGRLLTLVLASTLVSACAASPYDFPVPVMVDGRQATSMTGYMATDDEAVVRARLAERMRCPGGTEFLSLETQRADNALGTHILQYRAVMRCAEPPQEG